jgi:hypothetical protein
MTNKHEHDTIEEHVQCKECAQKACDETTEDMNKYNTQPNPQPNNSPHIVDLCIEDLKERKKKGVETYGVALQAFNGRSALRDLYEEIEDALLYSKQSILHVNRASSLLIHLRAQLDNSGEVNERTFELLDEAIRLLK